MILEGFISGLIGNILKELVVEVITKKWKRLNEKEVEKIVVAYLAQHHTPVLATTITKEVIVIMGELVGPDGQINLPLPNGTADPKLISDALETKYLKRLKDRLGSPTSSEHNAIPSQRETTGRVQRFEGGGDDPIGASLYWSQRYGAYPTWGWIAQCYENLGGTGGRLGFPTSLELDAVPSQRGTTGQVQRFEGGPDDPDGASVYYSSRGAYPTWGGIAQCYERLGGTGGRLGFPTSQELDAIPSPQGTTGKIQRFEGSGEDPDGASIYYCYHGYPVWGGIAQCYERLGGTGGRLGFPTSQELDAIPSPQGTAGRVQRFEGGDIYWCEKYGDVLVVGAILSHFEQHGGTGGRFGFPMSPENYVHGSLCQEFEGGIISISDR